MKLSIKKKIEKFCNNKKAFWSVVGTLIFLIVGGIAFVLGAELSGWHVLAYLYNSQAVVFYFIFFLIAIPITIALIIYKYCFVDKNDKGSK